MAKFKYPLTVEGQLSKGGKFTEMSPKEFLDDTQKMRMTKGDKKTIKKMKKLIKHGELLTPLKIYKDGGQDGRHRAKAAEKLGIDKLPVIDFRHEATRLAKKGGGPIPYTGDEAPYGVEHFYGVEAIYTPPKRKKKAKGGKTAAWQRSEGKNPEGGLNAKGRASAKAEGHDLKPPAPHPKTEKDAGRRKSFCSRMKGMKARLTSAETAHDPDSRINKSLRAWNCAAGGKVKRIMKQIGGELSGEVSFLEDQSEAPMPTFAQPQTQAITKALDVANAAQPREATMRSYEPTWRENLVSSLMGEQKPSPERRRFAEGVGEIAGLTPIVGQAMQAQEAARRGDTKGVLLATVPVPGANVAGKIAEGAEAAAARKAADVVQRVTNPIGMHSHAAEVARNLPQQSGPIEQMLAMVKKAPGVSPEEIHWSGVEKAFTPGQKVTAEDVAQHFEQNLPQVRETIYSDSNINQESLHKAFEDYFEDEKDVLALDYPALSMSELKDAAREGFMADAEAGEEYTRIYAGHSPQFSEWSTPGGTNYREIVLHHPVGQVEKPGTRMITYKYGKFSESKPFPVSPENLEKMKAKGFIIEDHGPGMMDAPTFTESHHDEPNIVGHLRVSDMKGPNDEKILNVHELQSDWGQKGRKHGFRSNLSDEQRRARIGELAEEQSRLSLLDDNPRFDEITNEMQNLAKAVPPAPYVTSREGSHNTPGWTDLLVKRIMQEAERGGYDKVVFDTVDEQIKRYSGLAETKKGMPEYYGNILPKRLAKVMKHADPDFKMTEHEVGPSRRLEPIKYDKDTVRSALSEMDAKLFPNPDDYDPEVSYLSRYFRGAEGARDFEHQLRKTGLHDDYILHQGEKQGIKPPRVSLAKEGDHFVMKDEESGRTWLLANRKEALAAMKTYSADKVMEKIKSGTLETKRPGFDVTEAVKSVGRAPRAYRRGGDAHYSIDQNLGVTEALRLVGRGRGKKSL